MRTICFINNKGGVGKTASVTTIAHMMAKLHNKRVLIIDLDPQGNASNMYDDIPWFNNFLDQLRRIDMPDIICEIPEDDPIPRELSVEDLLVNKDLDPHKVIKHAEYNGEPIENLDIIPAYLTLSTVEEQLKADITTPQQFKLKEQMKKIQNEYDYCLIDCSPSINILNINGLVASDEVYIPLRCDGNSCFGLSISLQLIETVRNYSPALTIGGCFFTQFNQQKNVSKVVTDLLQNVFVKNFLLPISIGTSKLMEEITFEQTPLLEKDNGKHKSKVTLQYMDLTEYLLAPNKKIFLKEYESRQSAENQSVASVQ